VATGAALGVTAYRQALGKKLDAARGSRSRVAPIPYSECATLGTRRVLRVLLTEEVVGCDRSSLATCREHRSVPV